VKEPKPAFVYRFNPAVPRHYLLGIAGLLWTAADATRCTRAITWLDVFSFDKELVFESTSVALAIAGYSLGSIWSLCSGTGIKSHRCRNVPTTFIFPEDGAMNSHLTLLSRPRTGLVAVLLLIHICSFLHAQTLPDRNLISTFSIVGRDSTNGELGVAVASRFFAVGSVVPWARADVGAVATQSFANTSFGWRALELLERGGAPQELIAILLRNDADPARRQFGIVAADGKSSTYTGKDCLPWAGGRHGANYAVQGNILAAEAVVAAMESTFVQMNGTLAERLYAALVSGDRMGGDARGKQSAALLVVKKNAGYGGFTDRAIDIRVDDHPEPFNELGRLLNYAQMNYAWNEGWTLFMQRKAGDALPHLERAAQLAPKNPEVLYDLAVIRLAGGRNSEALDALRRALELNPKLKSQARGDSDMQKLKGNIQFEKLIR
jgi:uncharacterized Ntn-hydrolase superfamily protein